MSKRISSLFLFAALIMTGCPPPMESPVIEITLQPTATINVTASNITGTLSVEATATGGVKLNYQWYSNTTNSYTGSTAIAGATSASYKIPATWGVKNIQ